MSRPPYGEDLQAELDLLNAMARAGRSVAEAWKLADHLVTERRLSVDTVAKLTNLSARTVARRLAESRAGEAGHV